MKKLRVLRDMPNYPKGIFVIVDRELLGFSVDDLIKDGWLEEVEERKTLVEKFSEAKVSTYPHMAKIAMEHAARVVQRAMLEWNAIDSDPLEMHILKALKKESESIK